MATAANPGKAKCQRTENMEVRLDAAAGEVDEEHRE